MNEVKYNRTAVSVYWNQDHTCVQLVGNDGRFAFSFASSSNLRCFCFSSMYRSRVRLSDFCMTIDMIQSSTTTPKAIMIYFTILPPICLIIITHYNGVSTMGTGITFCTSFQKLLLTPDLKLVLAQ